MLFRALVIGVPVESLNCPLHAFVILFHVSFVVQIIAIKNISGRAKGRAGLGRQVEGGLGRQVEGGLGRQGDGVRVGSGGYEGKDSVHV